MVISHVIHFLQISVCQKMAKTPMSLNLKLVKFIIQIIFNIDQKKLILCIKQLIRHSFRDLGLLNKLKWIAQKNE